MLKKSEGSHIQSLHLRKVVLLIPSTFIWLKWCPKLHSCCRQALYWEEKNSCNLLNITCSLNLNFHTSHDSNKHALHVLEAVSVFIKLWITTGYWHVPASLRQCIWSNPVISCSCSFARRQNSPLLLNLEALSCWTVARLHLPSLMSISILKQITIFLFGGFAPNTKAFLLHIFIIWVAMCETWKPSHMFYSKYH